MKGVHNNPGHMSYPYILKNLLFLLHSQLKSSGHMNGRKWGKKSFMRKFP